jgi:hypothetical protein
MTVRGNDEACGAGGGLFIARKQTAAVAAARIASDTDQC